VNLSDDKKRFSLTLTRPYVKALNSLVEEGLYLDHQDAIRDAMRRLFRFHGIKPFTTHEPPEEPR
jgi:Arc/MetJ-type ribon-helix-helix transcriptional regulator